MSETPFYLRAAAAGAVFLAPGVAVAGCGMGEPSYADAPQIARCLDTPIPEEQLPPAPKPDFPTLPPNATPEQVEQYLAASEAAEKKFDQEQAAFDKALNPPVLHEHVSGNFTEGDPVVLPDRVSDTTTKAIVEISTPDWKGTGFAVTDNHGRQVIVTAAHVVGTAAMKQLTLMTDDGREAHPTGGCYIYDDNGRFKKLHSPSDDTDEGMADNDLAILTLAKPLAHTVLKFADKPLQPGTWVGFVNYQDGYGPAQSDRDGDYLAGPAEYTGVVTPKNTYTSQLQVITGAEALGPKATVGEFSSTHIQGGASGGPVVDLKTNEVEGISVNGTKDGLYLGNDSLQADDHISFDGVQMGEKTGFEPTEAGVVPAAIVRLALQSKTLLPQHR